MFTSTNGILTSSADSLCSIIGETASKDFFLFTSFPLKITEPWGESTTKSFQSTPATEQMYKPLALPSSVVFILNTNSFSLQDESGLCLLLNSTQQQQQQTLKSVFEHRESKGTWREE